MGGRRSGAFGSAGLIGKEVEQLGAATADGEARALAGDEAAAGVQLVFGFVDLEEGVFL